MSKISSKALLAVALVLSLITSVLVYSYLKGVAQRASKDSAPVIVAKVDIPPKTAITQAMLQMQQMPAEYLQPGALGDPKLVVGVMAREQILAGEQITERRLIIQGKSVGFAGIIPKDKRAVTMAVTEVTGVAGFIKAGDYVDVITTFDQNAVGDNVSHMILQNVLVLAHDQDTEAGIIASGDKDKKDQNAVKTATVTLAVTPEEASQLALSEEKGKVRLALRPYAPANGVVITNAITPRELMGVQMTAPPSEPVTQAPAAKPAPESGKGIITIRGTKVETVPVN